MLLLAVTQVATFLAPTRDISRQGYISHLISHHYYQFNPKYQEPQILYDNANSVGFMFGYSTNAVTVKEEAYIYPLQSFVSEFGGSLGLFVGFSFLTIWDWILLLVKCFTLQCKQK